MAKLRPIEVRELRCELPNGNCKLMPCTVDLSYAEYSQAILEEVSRLAGIPRELIFPRAAAPADLPPMSEADALAYLEKTSEPTEAGIPAIDHVTCAPPCPDCGGTGQIVLFTSSEPCPRCTG